MVRSALIYIKIKNAFTEKCTYIALKVGTVNMR